MPLSPTSPSVRVHAIHTNHKLVWVRLHQFLAPARSHKPCWEAPDSSNSNPLTWKSLIPVPLFSTYGSDTRETRCEHSYKDHHMTPTTPGQREWTFQRIVAELPRSPRDFLEDDMLDQNETTIASITKVVAFFDVAAYGV